MSSMLTQVLPIEVREQAPHLGADGKEKRRFILEGDEE